MRSPGDRQSLITQSYNYNLIKVKLIWFEFDCVFECSLETVPVPSMTKTKLYRWSGPASPETPVQDQVKQEHRHTHTNTDTHVLVLLSLWGFIDIMRSLAPYSNLNHHN